MTANVSVYIGRQSAWHQLGEVLSRHFSWAEVCNQEKGLGFDVRKEQLLDARGNPVDAWGTFRTDTDAFLGAVGEQYTIIPHKSGFEVVDALIASQDGAHYETAGVLKQGQVVWGLADLSLTLHVGPHDTWQSYLLMLASYDGSYSHTYRMTDTRVVCQNTLTRALSSKTLRALTFRHTKNAAARLTDARLALESIGAEAKTFEDRLNILARKKMTRDTMTSVLDRLFPAQKDEDGKARETTRRDNILAEVLSYYENNDRDAFPEQRGTAYNLLNAVVEYTDHSRSAKGGDKGRAESAVVGSGYKLKGNTLELILEEAKTLPDMPSATPVYSMPAAPTLLDSVLENTPQ